MSKHWRRFGPLTIRTGLPATYARWGHPRVVIGGLNIWAWCNDGSFQPFAYHPRWSYTWRWCTWISKGRRVPGRFLFRPRFKQAAVYFAGYTCEIRWQNTIRITNQVPS